MHPYHCLCADPRCAHTALCSLRYVTMCLFVSPMSTPPLWSSLVRPAAPPSSCYLVYALLHRFRCGLHGASCTLPPHTVRCSQCTLPPLFCDLATGATPILCPVFSVPYPSQPPPMVAADSSHCTSHPPPILHTLLTFTTYLTYHTTDLLHNFSIGVLAYGLIVHLPALWIRLGSYSYYAPRFDDDHAARAAQKNFTMFITWVLPVFSQVPNPRFSWAFNDHQCISAGF